MSVSNHRLPATIGWVLAVAWGLAACGEDPEAVAGKPAIPMPDVVLPGDDILTEDDGEADAADDTWLQPDPEPCEDEGGWGCACTNNDECTSGYCIDSEQGKVCTKYCSASCPKDWKCVQAPGSTDLSYVCVPLYTNLCKPCTGHQDCAQAGADKGENLCIPNDDGQGFVNGSFCGTGCSEESGCKAGYACKAITIAGREEPLLQCVPETGECACLPAWTALQLATPCVKVSGSGECKSSRVCTEAGLTLCNATVPSDEVCDNEDNDCDGKTDEDDAVGCEVYYADNDLDGAGIGAPVCLCQNPGAGFSKNGGDCDDKVALIKPGADEICDDVDNNCNGDTDESGAKGCDVFYKDKDGDKFGDPDDSACLCKSKKTSDWIPDAGDCDDADDKIKPGVAELCNVGIDDNCNGKTDEEAAQGCKLYYIDQDGDTYGPPASGKCLCTPNKVFKVEQPGDCDDANAKIHPNVVEICNGIDDDCSGTTDDGGAEKSCPVLSQGQAGCSAGKCSVGGCTKPWFDVDGSYENGCECQGDNNFGVKGDACGNAIDLGQLGDGSQTVIKSGNVMPGESGDWYHFLASDSPDADQACDQFDVRAWLSSNPGGQFAVDFYRGSCAGASQLCTGETEVEWTTSYWGAPKGLDAKMVTPTLGDVVKSPNPQMAGECKCAGGTGMPGMNICSDNSAHFYVRVFRKPGFAPTCELYMLSVINAPPK